MSRKTLTARIMTIGVAVCLLCCDAAQAKKPDKPGGGSPGGGESDGQVFISTSKREIWKVDLPSGHKTRVGSTPELFFDLAVSPDGLLYGLGYSPAALYRIDTNTAEVFQIGELGYQDPGGFNSMDFDPNGDLYVARTRLLNVDPFTASSVVIGDTGFVATGDLAISPDGTFFMSSFGPNGIDDLVVLDSGTGSGRLIGPIGFSNVYGMDFVGDTLYGITEDGRIIEIDPVTGSGTRVRKLGIRGSAFGMAGIPTPMSSSAVSVPEPSTALFAMTGLVAIFGLMGRRRLHASQIE